MLGSFCLTACLLPLGLAGKRRRDPLLLAVGLGMSLLLLMSCGGGGSSDDSSPGQPVADLRSQPVSNLTAGTTYYWRVLSQDSRDGTSISEVFSFTTAP
jgi:hypothetical protein